MNKEKNLVLDVEESPKKIHEWLLFGIQHVLAMLVACITVPLLTGLPVAATIIAAGIGTFIYIALTKGKSPVFLSSSFAYIAPMQSALAVGLLSGATKNNFLALIIGMVLVGIMYCVFALIIKRTGTAWLNKVLPPIVVGPIIMVIGLSLAGSAINNLTLNGSNDPEKYNWIAIISGLVALIATALASHYGKKMMKLIPFIIGMGSGYIVAVLFTLIGYYGCGNEYFNVVSFTAFTNIFAPDKIGFASFFNYKLFIPNDPESFIFLRFDQIAQFDWTTIGTVILLFLPVSFVTMCEHIGDHENLGNIIDRDLLNGEPGMARTLSGDGIATAVSGILCGAANTTYGENVAVIGLTRIASTKVVLLAAIMSILIGFFTPFTALLQTVPAAVTGGVSLILYGFIASSGVKMLIKEKIDLTNQKNIFIASAILVSGIGGLTLKFGNPSTPVITITSVAVAMILGIILNVILVDKKDKTPVTETPVLENNETKTEVVEETTEIK